MATKTKNEGEPTELDVLEPVELAPEVEEIATSVVEYSALARGVALMRHRMQNIHYDLATVRGNKEARRDRALLVRARNLIDERRLALNADDRARIKARDDEAKRLIGLVRELEDPLDASITQDEERREAEREAKEQAEADRIAGLQARVDAIRQQGWNAVGKPPAEVLPILKWLEELVVDDSFAEFQTPAGRARDETLAKVKVLYLQGLAAEEKAKREAEERAAAERKEAEQRAENQRLDGILNTFVHGLRTAGLPSDLDAELRMLEQLAIPAEFDESRRLQAQATISARRTVIEREAQRRQQEDEHQRLVEERKRLKAEREEAEKAERERAIEARRVKAHEDKLAAWRLVPAGLASAGSERILGIQDHWRELAIGDDWEEFKPRAEEVRAMLITQLDTMAAAAREREAEAGRLLAQQAELDRQRREFEERQRAAAPPPPISPPLAGTPVVIDPPSLAGFPVVIDPAVPGDGITIDIREPTEEERRLIDAWLQPRPNVYVTAHGALTVTVQHPSNDHEALTVWVGPKRITPLPPRVDELIDVLRGICETAVEHVTADGYTVPRDRMEPARELLARIE